MAQYLPAPPMTSPGATPHQPDDGDLQTRLPSICVDYLSHTWEEEDVWASWRSITRRKNEVANGVRLENASWRTWWKQRNKLKTISPETLNWLKDSDVTWLYGPLHTAVEAVPPPKVATAEERLGLLQAGGKKPILKHRTLSEILTTPMPSSPVLESLDFGDEDSDDFEGADAEQRYSLLQTKSDTNIFRRNSVSRKNSPSRGPVYPPALGSPDSEAPGGKKHISFNTFVEQCISLDEPTSISPDRDFDDDEDDEDEDDDDVLEMRSTSSVTSSVISLRPTISRQSSIQSEKEHFTIAHIAPARLKTTGDELETSTIFVPPGGTGNATSGSSRYNAQEQSSRTSSEAATSPAPAGGYDFPSSIEAAQYDDDDDEYDYFGGPGRGGGASGNSIGGGGGRSAAGGNPLGSRGASVAPSGVGSVGHYETSSNSPSSSSTSVNQTAPASSVSVPRKGASIAPPQTSSSGNTTTPPSGNSSSGTTTPSPSPTTSDFPQRVNVTPSRSILKNRSGPVTPSTSPEVQTSYFVPPSNSSAAHTSSNTSINAAPSGAAPQAFLPPVSGSTGHTPISQLPVSVHAQSEENTTRGRSAVRSSSGTSLSDRVPSRSNSGGGASISPSVSSSPIVSSSQPVASILTSPPAGRGARPPSIKTTNVSTGQPLQPAAPGSDDGGGTGGLGSPKAGEGFWADGDEKKDGEGKDEAYKYAESTNPTPNSSPLISMRTLSIDSSAASLPHAQSKPSPPVNSTSAAPFVVSHTHPGASTVTPGGATSVASPSSATSSLQRTTSNNSAASSPFANSTAADDGASKEQKGAGGVVATARDLLGALWGMAGEGGKKA